MKIESAPFFSTGGLPSMGMLGDYARDSWQRIVLYADVMRRRGNQYQEHLAEEVPNVLDFPAELVLSGLDLARPVNYGLARILTPDAPPPDPGKRPFVVVDPRAGHGPGIGGFKAESEIGVALRAGHPCYFIGFLPDPVPGQTVEDVMHAEAAFLEQVIALHPLSEGKPVVIGNCQAGWQILMTAAMRPELFGPIIVAGAPVSYWAGWHGRNPMRYAGGLMGGSWATALAGDLGNGRFDGASLVQNFEKLNPANTLWSKQYNLYANIDTEAPRYLEFEKYWGGHVFLNDVEMQYIVDNLFIGNRLATAELITSDGVRLDLRNIRSPIVVFCSNGDNITPPPQALGWITDLYRDDNDVLMHDQTIVYAVHDSIGHLGIFVSAKVGHKEHQKFASNIDLINLLPAGIYEARIVDKTPETPNADLASGDYVLQVEHRGIEDVRAIVQPDVENDRKFAAAARVSEVNLALYRSFAQPWVRAMVTPQSARLLQLTHPLRVSYERWTDHNPLAKLVAREAEKVRSHRHPVAPDNPLLAMQEAFSGAMNAGLNSWSNWRDTLQETTFDMIYGSPLVQALTGQTMGAAAPPRPHPGISPEHCEYVRCETRKMDEDMQCGGLVEAAVRALFYIYRFRMIADERRFNLALKLIEPQYRQEFSMEQFRGIVRQQARLMLHDFDAAIAALPVLLSRADPDDIGALADWLQQVLQVPVAPTPDEEASLQQMLARFERATKAQAKALPQARPASKPAKNTTPA
ncbi:pimeloyl-ACP methyl ester carboxylesterase [Janthinobacterium sp. CG_23.4]|nr:pimeloyl-ACP methyl ester carboxylesterase [Janthinobacterium sp. CG_23.4]